jgi:hypothetical protein
MQIFAYLWLYLFRIVHVFWTARGCVDGVSFYGLLRSEIEFGSASPLFSGYTISLTGRVFGEQRGGATKILSRIEVDHRN